MCRQVGGCYCQQSAGTTLLHDIASAYGLFLRYGANMRCSQRIDCIAGVGPDRERQDNVSIHGKATLVKEAAIETKKVQQMGTPYVYMVSQTQNKAAHSVLRSLSLSSDARSWATGMVSSSKGVGSASQKPCFCSS